jgi:hypothetical protein
VATAVTIETMSPDVLAAQEVGSVLALEELLGRIKNSDWTSWGGRT